MFRRCEYVSRPLQIWHRLSQDATRGRPEESSVPLALGLAGGYRRLGRGLELRPPAVAELGAQPQQGELPTRSLGALKPEEGMVFHCRLPQVFTGTVRGQIETCNSKGNKQLAVLRDNDVLQTVWGIK